MKTLHSLNKGIASLLMFLKSFAGAGFILIVVFLADLGANTLGVQTFIGHRMQEMIMALGLTTKQAFVISCTFSALLSSALGVVIIQAVLHSKHISNMVLSFMSVYLSFSGLAYMMLKGVSMDQLGNLDTSTYVGLSIVLVLALTPPIAYNMNANLVVETFGPILDKFNMASVQELDKSFEAQVNTLAKEDVASTKKKSKKRLRKLGVTEQPKENPVMVGETIDMDNLFSSLNDN